jgi:ribonuclease P/MRP protein subunit POP5
MQLKAIPPTMRERKRYLLVKVEPADHIVKHDLEDAILNSCLRFLGELGVAKAGIVVLLDTYDGKKVIIKTGHKFVDETKTAISLIKTIANKNVRLSTISVSGSLLKLKSKK